MYFTGNVLAASAYLVGLKSLIMEVLVPSIIM